MSELHVRCKSCGAGMSEFDWNAHRCPWYVAPAKGESFEDYQTRFEDSKEKWLKRSAK